MNNSPKIDRTKNNECISPILAKRLLYMDGFKKCLFDKVYNKLIFINDTQILVFNKDMSKSQLCNITFGVNNNKFKFSAEYIIIYNI